MESLFTQIKELKDKGNDYFKVKDYLKALNTYEDCMQLLLDREYDLSKLSQEQEEIKN